MSKIPTATSSALAAARSNLSRMKRGLTLLAVLTMAPAPPPVCESLTALGLANVRITEAKSFAAADGNVAHCRASGVIDDEIRFTALLPEKWNGRLFAGGAGGFAGSIENHAQASVNLGYATVGNDTGHQAPGTVATWALGNRKAQENYGHAAVHRTTEITKALLESYYGEAPRYSYFLGCSNGGR